MHASFISTLFLVLASTVTSLSLGDLESIPSDAVTPGCYTAYNKEIAACPDAASFRAKDACSAECSDALSTFAQETILSCRQAFVSPDSLLRKLLDGGLVTTLCPASSSSSSSSAAETTTAAASKSSSAVVSSAVASSAVASSAVASSAVASSAVASSSTVTVTSASSTQASIKTKTESAVSTITPESVSFSGFMTITASSAASTASIPSELTLDDSAEPTGYGGYAAYAVESGSGVISAAQASSTAVSNGAPFDTTISSSDNVTMDSTGAAGSVKAVWGTAVVGALLAVGAILV